MATAREYLQSIVAQAALLQNLPDEDLEVVVEHLRKVDDEMPSADDIREIKEA